MTVLIDSNVLVYVHDASEPERRGRARDVLEHYGRSRGAVLSVQSLSEFAAVALRKFRPPLPTDRLRVQVDHLRRRFGVHPVTDDVVDEALRGVEDFRLPYFDAQIWAVARLHSIPVIISEDARPGELDGVRWFDPFEPGFDPATLPS